jgi:hypothetical protein
VCLFADDEQLLDQYYADTVVREYAVQCLCDMTDTELVNHLLQLVQALKCTWTWTHNAHLTLRLLTCHYVRV